MSVTNPLTADDDLVDTDPQSLAPKRWRILRLRVPRLIAGRFALVAGLAMLAIIIILCVGAPLFTHWSPTQINPALPLAAPGTDGHLLGTDQYGRDVWSRLLYGGRYDLAIAFGATSVTLVAGTIIGMGAAVIGGWVDAVVMRIVDLVFAFPFIVLVIAIIAALGPSLLNMFIALWVASWVGYARISHSQALSARRYGYVVAANSLGYSTGRIVLRHVLPSVFPVVIVFAMVDAVGNVLLGASLGFLGIGIQPPTPEWGAMISDGQNYLLTNWQLPIIPGIALVLLGIAFSLIGDGLADLMRVKQ
jgi:peptide/nickel transport system permease protein